MFNSAKRSGRIFKKAHANTRVFFGLFGARLATCDACENAQVYINSVADYGLCQLNSRSQAANGRFARWKKIVLFSCFFYLPLLFLGRALKFHTYIYICMNYFLGNYSKQNLRRTDEQLPLYLIPHTCVFCATNKVKLWPGFGNRILMALSPRTLIICLTGLPHLYSIFIRPKMVTIWKYGHRYIQGESKKKLENQFRTIEPLSVNTQIIS